jgi:hypothetical protein
MGLEQEEGAAPRCKGMAATGRILIHMYYVFGSYRVGPRHYPEVWRYIFTFIRHVRIVQDLLVFLFTQHKKEKPSWKELDASSCLMHSLCTELVICNLSTVQQATSPFPLCPVYILLTHISVSTKLHDRFICSYYLSREIILTFPIPGSNYTFVLLNRPTLIQLSFSRRNKTGICRLLL